MKNSKKKTPFFASKKWEFVRLMMFFLGLCFTIIATAVPARLTDKYAYTDDKTDRLKRLTPWEMFGAVLANMSAGLYMVLTAIIFAEIIFRIVVLRKHFFINRNGKIKYINLIDILILLLDLAFNIFLFIFNIVELGTRRGTNARNYDIIIGPYVGTLAVTRALVFIMIFNYEMKRLLIGLVRSFGKLFWSFILMVVLMYIFAFCFFWIYSKPLEDDCTGVCQDFRNIYVAFWSVYKIMTGDTSVADNMESRFPSYVFVIVFFFFVAVIALNVIQGIVIDSIAENKEKRTKLEEEEKENSLESPLLTNDEDDAIIATAMESKTIDNLEELLKGFTVQIEKTQEDMYRKMEIQIEELQKKIQAMESSEDKLEIERLKILLGNVTAENISLKQQLFPSINMEDNINTEDDNNS